MIDMLAGQFNYRNGFFFSELLKADRAIFKPGDVSHHSSQDPALKRVLVVHPFDWLVLFVPVVRLIRATDHEVGVFA